MTDFTDTNEVAVTAGDLVELRITTNVAAGAHTIQTSLEFEADATDTTVYPYGGAGDVLSTPPTNCPLFYAGGNGCWVTDANLIGPGDRASTAGTITQHYVHLVTAPSSGKSRTFTIYKNGVAQDGTGGTPDTTVTISDTATDGNAAFSLSVAANDELWVRHTASGSPTNTHRGNGMIEFVSTASAKAMYGGSSNSNPSNLSTTYQRPGGFNTGGWDVAPSTDNDWKNGPTPFDLDAWRIDLDVAPGSGNSYVFTLIKNGSPTALTITIADAATTGSVTSTVTIDDGDTWCIEAVPSSTPTNPQGMRWAFVASANVAPEVDAGADVSADILEVVELSDASASDDALPNPPAALTYTWTKQSGPGTATWSDTAALNPWVYFNLAGTYVLRLTVTDGAIEVYDERTVTVNGRVSQGNSICSRGLHFTWIETTYTVIDA